ncbi:MAG: hypothetical protein QNI90_10725 [Dinoroseobacter sp.]|nr:hypothetical protein [Dinoroseobacter sp.]
MLSRFFAGLLTGVVLLGFAHIGLAEEDPEINLLFVQTSKSVEIDTAKGSLCLRGVSGETIYFSDRPYRLAGHVSLARFLEGWSEGADSFAESPPNAAISIYDESADTNAVAIITLYTPEVDGDDLLYSFALVEGELPSAGDSTALFIDKFGVGGGAGRGYHGVGAGRRGPGVGGWAGVAVINECERDGNC